MSDTFGLTGEQLDLLLRPLSPTRVREHKGSAHLEAWDVRRWLTRIFGFGGWSDEILSMECIHSVTSPIGDDPNPLKHRCTAVYRVTLRLTVKDVHGNVISSFEDGATGEGVNQVSVGDAHDLALKAAVSQALKRCAVNLGDQFGLSLYNKGSLDAAVVRTLGHPVAGTPSVEHTEDAPVVGGELDDADAQQPVAEPATAGKLGDQPEAPRMISDGQSKAVHALLAAKFGKKTDAERHDGFSKFTGREITSAKQLTFAEASNLIDAMSKLPDHALTKPAAVQTSDDPNANFHQAEALLKLEQQQGRQAEELEQELRDAIESADSPNDLAAAMSDVAGLRDAGRITGEQHTRLAAAADERAARGRRQYAGATA